MRRRRRWRLGVRRGPRQVGLLGDGEGGEQHVLSDQVGQPGPLERYPQVGLDPRQGEADTPGGEVAVEVAQAVGGGDVDFDVGFDVEDEPSHGVLGAGGVLLVHREQGAPAHVGDVGEEQRGVVAVDDEARQGLGVGVVVDVVHPGQSRHPAEHAFVGASQPHRGSRPG